MVTELLDALLSLIDAVRGKQSSERREAPMRREALMGWADANGFRTCPSTSPEWHERAQLHTELFPAATPTLVLASSRRYGNVYLVTDEGTTTASFPLDVNAIDPRVLSAVIGAGWINQQSDFQPALTPLLTGMAYGARARVRALPPSIDLVVYGELNVDLATRMLERLAAARAYLERDGVAARP